MPELRNWACEPLEKSVSERRVVSQEWLRATPEDSREGAQVTYLTSIGRFCTKLSQLGTARGDKDKSQIAKMAQPMISKIFKVHGHAHRFARTAFYEA